MTTLADLHNALELVLNLGVAGGMAVFAVAAWGARRREPALRPLSAFAALIAANYVLVAAFDILPSNVPTLNLEPPTGFRATIFTLSLIVQLFDPIALFWFAGAYVRNARARHPLARASVLAAAAVSGVLLTTDPSGATGFANGSGLPFLVESTYVFAVYLAVLVLLVRDLAQSRPGPTSLGRDRVVAGFGIVVALRLSAYGPLLAPWPDVATTPPYPVFMLRTFILFFEMAVLFVGVVWFASRGPSRDAKRIASTMRQGLAAIAVVFALEILGPVLTIVLGGLWAVPNPTSLQYAVGGALSNGLYAIRWLGFMVIAGPALLQDPNLAIHPRVRRVILLATAAVFLGILLFAAIILLEDHFAALGLLDYLLLAALLVLGTQAGRLAARTVDAMYPAHAEQDEAYRRVRVLEYYGRAADAVAAGTVSANGLDALATELQISMEERRMADAIARRRVSQRVADTAPSTDLVGGRFRLIRLVGAGSHGRVWQACDERTGESVAVKIFDRGPALGLHADAEVLAARRIEHHGILPPSTYGIDGLTEYVVYPFLPGGSLADRIARGSSIPLTEAIDIVDEVLQALSAAHAAGVLHLDVKPSNILFTGNGRPVLTDFGVARQLAFEETDLNVIESGPMPGTYAYVPPEAFDGAPATASNDIYAAGRIARELFGKVSGPSGVPASLRNVVERALSPRGERYRSADEFRRALRDAWRAPAVRNGSEPSSAR